MIACAIAIRLDSPGPILFRHLRVGYNGRKFALLKFRSMYEDASDPGAVQQTSRADPRVTRIGRFMRATSLDELPQLINVLRGEMSLVGPRPHALAMTAEGIPVDLAANDYAFRHRVKPGMTGWAQVNGSRGEVSTVAQLARRTELDLWYIQHASVGLDLWILLRTVNIVILNRGAY